ncbi:MAG: hypothetical protein HOP08_00305 [Cyclobacteriaceae bacterium]|nr:hypothetical protein [Cyclobacteriaceae bacterium]
MKRSQKIFIAIMLLFFGGLIMLAYDISTKTTFPGARNRKKASLDTVSTHPKDSSGGTLSPKSAGQQP